MAKEKLSLEEYKKNLADRAKNPFKMTLYPPPVLAALLVPLCLFIMSVLVYIFYIKGAGE